MFLQRSESFRARVAQRNFSRGLEAIERFAVYGALVLSALVALMAISVAISENGLNARLFFRSFSVGFACVFAATALGAAFGFIFGIPRVLQRRPGGIEKGQQFAITEKTGSQLFFTNTSLEEISDWLTKIIVGIGLVQFTAILESIHAASLFAAAFVYDSMPALEPPAGTNATRWLVANHPISSFLFSIIVTSLLSTCLFVYVEMRTRVTRIFLVTEKEVAGTEADGPISMPKLIGDIPEVGGSTGKKLQGGGTQHFLTLLEPSTEERALAMTSWDQLNGPAQIGTWAVAQAKDKNFQVAEDALREALKLAPGNVNLLQRLAELRLVRRNDQGFVETMNELAVRRVSMAPDLQALFEKALLIALYLSGRDSVEKALHISNVLIEHPPVKAITYLHRACALGQKYAFLDSETAEAQKVRANALDALRKVVELVPDPMAWERVLMRQLYDPKRFNGKPSEDDLTTFRGDTEFEELITGGVE